ncbi:MAG: MlaD family protein [Armatimonadota bacterium]
MSISPAIKVGILVVTAALFFFGAHMFLNANLRNAYSIKVVFNDIAGMTEGSAVNMSGVAIGTVKKITLNDKFKAVAEMSINDKYTIPKGSRFILRVGMLIGEKFIDVIPNRELIGVVKPGAIITGETPTTIDDLIPKADKIFTNLANASDTILPKTAELINNLNEVSIELKKVMSDKNLSESLNRTFKNIETATSTLEETLNSVKGLVTTNDDELYAILNNTKQASLSFREAAESLAEFTKDKTLQDNLAGTLVSVRSSVESLQRSMGSMERSLSGLESLATSPEMHTDVKETVSGARKAVDQTNKILEKVGGIFGTKKDGESIFKPKLPKLNTTIDSIYRPGDGRFRTTLGTSLKFGGNRSLNLGAFDIGGTNKLIVQSVEKIGPGTDIRIGMYASKLGVGLDQDFSRKVFGSIDLYDPTESTLDLKFGYRINPSWSMIFGVDSLLEQNQFMLGVQVKK